jgi:tetratricopeptide (TPR) repeat protein
MLNWFSWSLKSGDLGRRLDLRELERKLEFPRTLRVMPNEHYKPRIFISYAHADEPERPAEGEVKWLSFVERYLRPALKQGAVEIWIDRLMRGGDPWNPEIERRLRDCDIFILLVSPNSLSSDYVVDKEIAIIRERQTNREDIHFYPLVLTPTPEAGLDLVRDLNLRPRDGKPFSDYELSDRYRHMNEAANEIAAIAKEIAKRKDAAPSTAPPKAARNQSEKLSLSNIPISVPLHFLGRDNELAAIDAALKSEKGRIAALHGLRGVGKSTLAAAYVERHRNDYRATWWIRAQTPDTMRADLASLGVRLGWVAADEKEEPALAAVCERLRDEGEGLLLIYDNAIDARNVEPYLPPSGSAQVIVTSNAPDWSGIADPVEIEVWPKEIGADYLVARTQRDKERAEAEALSEALGGLPLAHEQAAAYCGRIGISLGDYRKRFEAAPARLLEMEKDAPVKYRLTVAKAFALAIDEAAKLHPAAEPLIVHAALLAPEPIPLFLFSEAREEFGEPLASQLADGLDEAVAALRAFALVDRKPIVDERNASITTDAIRLHRLVREIAAARREGEARDQFRRALVAALAAVYPVDGWDNKASWPRCEQFMPHLVVTCETETADAATNSKCADLLDRAGLYLHRRAVYSEARRLYERALAIREKTLGPDHPDTATSLYYLGSLLQEQGDFAGARPLYERALAIHEKALGPDHPATAASLNDLCFRLTATLRGRGGSMSARWRSARRSAPTIPIRR